MMEYKGYLGKVEFDDEADVFHGELINTRDVITFQGQSVAELKQAFRDSVDDYLTSSSMLGRGSVGSWPVTARGRPADKVRSSDCPLFPAACLNPTIWGLAAARCRAPPSAPIPRRRDR